ESFHQGTLLYIGIQEGEAAPVDHILAIIGEQGEVIPVLLEGGSAPIKAEEEEEKTAGEEASEPKTEERTTARPAPGTIPEGVEISAMPTFSDTMEEGTAATWLKKVGYPIAEGDSQADTDPTQRSSDLESFHQGTLLYIGIQEGEA